MKRLSFKTAVILIAVMMLVSLFPMGALAAGTDVAEVNGVGYDDIQEAIDAAAAGDKIVLVDDITLDSTVKVPAGKKITIDLNGKAVSMVYTENATSNHEMLLNKGDLTIEDSVGGGKLSYEYKGASLGTSYAANTITTEPGSVLTVKGGTIENLTYDSAIIAYAIDGRTNGGNGDVEVNIKGGTVKSERQAIRIFANSTTKTGTLNIEDGDITGRVIVQSSNASANKAVLKISGGTFNTNAYKPEVLYVGGNSGANMVIDVEVSGGTFNGEVISTVNKKFITGGTFSSDVSDLVAGGVTLTKNLDGTYGVCAHASSYVPAVAPTCKDGNIEYWHCVNCNKFFDDSELTHEIAEADIKVPAVDDHDFVDGACTVCGELDPDYEAPAEGEAPVITRQPGLIYTSMIGDSENTVYVEIAATGTPEITYTWEAFMDGEWQTFGVTKDPVLDGFYMPDGEPADYEFRCVVSNDFGEAISNTFVISFISDEAPAIDDEEEPSPEEDKDDVPDTGDNFYLVLVLALMGASAAAAAVLISMKKRASR
ncbi:MAG: hypothetical protein IJF27_02030 [Oscillospiraceae bacterium]|nr:hypothetical protein [Oscillospiraceae bacterium]